MEFALLPNSKNSVAKKGYNYPIKKKDTANSNYSVCVAYLLYTLLENISIVLSIKIDFL